MDRKKLTKAALVIGVDITFSLLLGLLAFWWKGGFALQGEKLLVLLCDICFLLCLLQGAAVVIILCINAGVFDGIGYATHTILKRKKKEIEKYADYKRGKRERKIGFLAFLVLCVVFLFLTVVFWLV